MLRTGIAGILVSLILPIAGCANNPEAAREKLEESGIQYTQKKFMECAMQGNTPALKLFLTAGMDPGAEEPDGMTALIIAAGQGQTGVVRLLLKSNADVNAQDKTLGRTALMAATTEGYTNIVDLLLDKGADPNTNSRNGMTALMIAARQGHTDIAKALLEKRANVTAKSREGLTALSLAKARQHADIVRLLHEAGAKE